MDKQCSDIRDLMSGYLDEELSDDEAERFASHLAGCDSCRSELEEMSMLVSASSVLSAEVLPDEVWDQFLLNVYNRTERQTGWIVFTVGTFLLLAWGIYEMVVLDWAGPLVKFSTGLAVLGVTILFVSVLRERLAIHKLDRYSSDIHR